MSASIEAGAHALRLELDAALERVQQLERANAELSQFAYIASHDLLPAGGRP